MIQLQKKPANHLSAAYNQIMQEMRDTYKRCHSSEMSLQKALDLAKHQAVHLGKITAEEAHEIGEYIKHDVNDAADYMMESSPEFHDWLTLDIELIEHRIIDAFLSAADTTRIELQQFAQLKPKNKPSPDPKIVK